MGQGDGRCAGGGDEGADERAGQVVDVDRSGRGQREMEAAGGGVEARGRGLDVGCGQGADVDVAGGGKVAAVGRLDVDLGLTEAADRALDGDYGRVGGGTQTATRLLGRQDAHTHHGLVAAGDGETLVGCMGRRDGDGEAERPLAVQREVRSAQGEAADLRAGRWSFGQLWRRHGARSRFSGSWRRVGCRRCGRRGRCRWRRWRRGCGRRLLNIEILPHVLRFVGIDHALGHVQLHIPQRDVVKDIRLDVGDRSGILPRYGEVRQRLARGKSHLSNLGDALREGDAWQHLETREGLLPDLGDALSKG